MGGFGWSNWLDLLLGNAAAAFSRYSGLAR